MTGQGCLRHDAQGVGATLRADVEGVGDDIHGRVPAPLATGWVLAAAQEFFNSAVDADSVEIARVRSP